MTSTIRIKRRNTGAPGAPSGLAASEIAYNEVDQILYYGDGNNAGQATSILSIGGPGAFLQTSHLADVGRNKIHNPLFNIQQRGQGPWTANVYTADRWVQFTGGGDTISTALYIMADSDRTQLGDEDAQYHPGMQFTGTATAASHTVFYQSIENVRRTAGKTVTLSFWARAVSGSVRIGTGWLQNFGSGGSPSVGTSGNFGVTPMLGTSYARYIMTAAIPSSAGKTLGTNNDHYFSVLFFLSCSPSDPYSGVAGGIGVQSGSVNIYGVQLEVGSQATPLEKLDPRMDFANCQRFYQIGATWFAANAVAANNFGYQYPLPVVMRAVPSVTLSAINYNNASGLAPISTTASTIFYAQATVSGFALFQANFTASADF